MQLYVSTLGVVVGGWVGGAMQLCVHLAARRCFIEHHTQTHFQMSSIGNISEENDLFRILQIIVRVMLKTCFLQLLK